MKEEVVLAKIGEVSGDNQDMKWLMVAVYRLGIKKIRLWSDGSEDEIVGRLIKASSKLIDKPISSRSLLLRGADYWETAEGMEANRALVDFVRERKR